MFTSEDLKEIEEIGRGNHGAVSRMEHIASKKIMAVKVSIVCYNIFKFISIATA